MGTQYTSYRDRWNAVLADAQLKGGYLGWFHERASKNRHSLHIGDVDSNVKRGGRTPLLGADGDDVEVVPSPGRAFVVFLCTVPACVSIECARFVSKNFPSCLVCINYRFAALMKLLNCASG